PAPIAMLWLEFLHDGRSPILTWIKNKIVAAGPSQPLPLLDGFGIVDDRAHLVGLEHEFRHIRGAGKNPFGQRLANPFGFELARKGTKRRGLRVRTGAAAADRMAAGAVGGDQRLPAPRRRAGLFAQAQPSDADGEQAEEQPAEHYAAHGPNRARCQRHGGLVTRPSRISAAT